MPTLLLAALDVTVERFLECYMKLMWCACVIGATGMHFKCPLACMGVGRWGVFHPRARAGAWLPAPRTGSRPGCVRLPVR